MSDTINTGEIAQLLGCTRHHVTARLSKRPDFPAPVINVSQKLRAWAKEDVEAWARRASRSDRTA